MEKDNNNKSQAPSRLELLNEEKEILEDDLDAIGDAVRAASKLSLNDAPSEDENEKLSSLKESYPSFFSSESEQTSSLLNEIMAVKVHLRAEIYKAKAAISDYEDEIAARAAVSKEIIETGESPIKAKTVETDKSHPIGTIESGESSSQAAARIKIGEFSTAAKRKAEDIEESSSKKNRQSPSEFVDELPYNPFDDIGTD